MRAIYISAYTGITVLLCLTLAQSAAAQTVFSGTSWSDFPGGAKAVCANELDNDPANDDIDEDNDGLIEMCYLEDVNAMRHQLDGSGYKSSGSVTKVTTGCGGGAGNDTCLGYELVRPLDFQNDDSYRDAETNKPRWTEIDRNSRGWTTIAGTFSAILEGNGHVNRKLIYNT